MTDHTVTFDTDHEPVAVKTGTLLSKQRSLQMSISTTHVEGRVAAGAVHYRSLKAASGVAAQSGFLRRISIRALPWHAKLLSKVIFGSQFPSRKKLNGC